MQYFAAFGGEEKVIERRPSAEPKGTVAGGGFGGLEGGFGGTEAYGKMKKGKNLH